MRDFFIYTILCLFCFAPAAAQEVPFEGLHLDDLISIPGERKPGIINHPVSAFELPGFKLLPSGHVLLLRHYPGISLPGMPPVPFPEKNNLRSYSFWQPLKRLTIRGDYFSSGILPVETYSSTAASSASSTYSSSPATPWLASTTASAILETISFTARIASSFPGIT